MTRHIILLLLVLLVHCIHANRWPENVRTVSARDDAMVIAAAKRTASRNLNLANFLSGGVAGSISSTLTMPLEVIKTQLQSSGQKAKPWDILRQILATDGPRGLFRGLQPMLVGIIPTRAVYFWAYGSTKAALNATSLGNSPATHLLSAFSAGIASNTFTAPIWMVKSRYQIIADSKVGQVNYKGYGDVVKQVLREEGILGFWKGLSASYVGCIEGAIQWLCYEKLKSTLLSRVPSLSTSVSLPTSMGGVVISSSRDGSATAGAAAARHRDNKPSAQEYFYAASVSKLVAILATYPHEVVRTRMREQSKNGIFKYKGFLNTLKVIAKEEGMAGLYGGMGMHIVR
jgi:solute carrier family 25, member 33/36